MDNTLLEINKHKFNIAEFSQKLITLLFENRLI